MSNTIRCADNMFYNCYCCGRPCLTGHVEMRGVGRVVINRKCSKCAGASQTFINKALDEVAE